MARKLKYPAWSDWLASVEAALKQILKETGLTGYTIGGRSTNLNVAVKSADQHMASQPYIEVILADVQNGWDDVNSGQLDYDGKTHESIGGDSLVESLNYVRERITFQLDIYTQKQTEAAIIAQTIKRHFNAFGELSITWRGDDLPVFTKLHDFSMEAVEAGREGKLEYFRASWLLTLSIISEQSASDTVVTAIKSVVTDVTDSIGDEDEDQTRTLTIE
jgi:hypothetical protein